MYEINCIAEETRVYTKDDLFKIPKINSNIKIDAELNEPEWKEALFIQFDNEIMPGENIKALVKTNLYIMHDEDNIYIAFIAYDPEPSQIRAHITDRDKAWLDDFVGIFFDTFNDRNKAFVFFVNPYGIQGDEIQSNGGNKEDITWDAIWNSAGKITSEGYVVELAIPFRSIQFQRTNSKQQWGFAPLRIYPRKQRYQISFFKLDRNNNCLQCQFPKLVGFEGVTPGKNIEINPTITGTRTRESNVYEDEPIPITEGTIDPGITASYAITANLKITGTYNPDFSQIEADAAQLDINTQFTLYYPEKRPFFLEGTDLFATQKELIYTRTLADPDWGLKLSGKEGNNAIGLFVVQDSNTNLLFPYSQESYSDTLEQKNIATVFRFRRDYGNSSNIGILITDREGDNYYNRLAAFDAAIRFTDSDKISLQFVGTKTLYPESIASDYEQKLSSFMGSAYRIFYSKDKRTYSIDALYEVISPDFRADLGFIPQVNYKKYLFRYKYIYWGDKDSIFSNIEIGPDITYVTDYYGNILLQENEFEIEAQGPYQTFFRWNTTFRKKVFNNTTFKNQLRNFFFFNCQPSGKIYIETRFQFGDEIDYNNTQPAIMLVIEPELMYNFTKNLSVSFSYLYNKLNVDKRRLYSAHLSETSIIYHLNSKTFFRAILQYIDIKRNLALYTDEVEPKERTFFTQLLFSYKLNPRTVIFIGYTDNRLGYLNTNLAQTDRTFFIKLGYALNI